MNANTNCASVLEYPRATESEHLKGTTSKGKVKGEGDLGEVLCDLFAQTFQFVFIVCVCQVCIVSVMTPRSHIL